MALRDKLAERAAPFLEPGEQVQEAFSALAGFSPWLRALGALAALLSKPRIVVVTDKAVLVMRAGRLLGTRPLELLARLPRATRIGPLSGQLWMKTTLNGETVWIHRRFKQDVERADAPLLRPPSS
jgi:hypothetical protein